MVNEKALNVFRDTINVTKVQLDGLALLQILKHGELKKSVNGSLLGMENDDFILEISHTFPSSGVLSDMEIMKLLSMVNVDNNKVGWYTSVPLNHLILECQYKFQKHLGPNALCIYLDKSSMDIQLKAFRLTCTLFNHLSQSRSIKEGLLNYHNGNMVEYIPIEVYNTDLLSCWLYHQKTTNVCSFKNLEICPINALELNAQHIVHYTHELSSEHLKFQNYERNLLKNRQRVRYAFISLFYSLMYLEGRIRSRFC